MVTVCYRLSVALCCASLACFSFPAHAQVALDELRPLPAARAQQMKSLPSPAQRAVKPLYTHPPRPEAFPVPPSDLATHTTLAVGVQVSDYHYQERRVGLPPVDVKVDGFKGGATVNATGALGYGWFTRAEGRVAGGPVDYKGSGNSNKEPDYLGELRITGGWDWIGDDVAISPIVGVGYRILRNDGRGQTTTGAWGYQRQSQYLFLPIGLQPRIRLSNGDQIRANLEYDYLLKGWQDSHLEVGGLSNVRNSQYHGLGLRGELLYSRDRWSLGPFVNYWNIQDSKMKYLSWGSGLEPQNQTLEIGLQLRYNLYQ